MTLASTALKLALATSAVVGAWLLGYGDGRAAASRIYSEDLLRQHRAQNVTLARMLNDADEKAQAEQARAVAAALARQKPLIITKEVVREVRSNPDPRACEWRPEQRLRVERIYGAAGYRADGTRAD